MKPKTLFKTISERTTVLAVIASIQLIYAAIGSILILPGIIYDPTNILVLLVEALIIYAAIGLLKFKKHGWYISVGLYLIYFIGSLINIVLFGQEGLVSKISLNYSGNGLASSVLELIIFGILLLLFFSQKTIKMFDFKDSSRTKPIVLVITGSVLIVITLAGLGQLIS